MAKVVPIVINDRYPVKILDFRADLPYWRYWEKETLAMMYATIRRGDTVLDIGAEQGDMSVLWSLWGANVILVEPQPLFWPNIRAVFEGNNQKPPLISFNGLASDKTDISRATDAKIYNNKWPKAADGEPNIDTGFYHLNEKPLVAEMTIDDIVGDTHVDVITMDIEGSELIALLGAEKVLHRDHPIIALSLHAEMMWKEHHNSPDDLHVHLDKFGYDGTYIAFDHESHWMYRYRGKEGIVGSNLYNVWQ